MGESVARGISVLFSCECSLRAQEVSNAGPPSDREGRPTPPYLFSQSILDGYTGHILLNQPQLTTPVVFSFTMCLKCTRLVMKAGAADTRLVDSL